MTTLQKLSDCSTTHPAAAVQLPECTLTRHAQHSTSHATSLLNTARPLPNQHIPPRTIYNPARAFQAREHRQPREGTAGSRGKPRTHLAVGASGQLLGEGQAAATILPLTLAVGEAGHDAAYGIPPASQIPLHGSPYRVRQPPGGIDRPQRSYGRHVLLQYVHCCCPCNAAKCPSPLKRKRWRFYFWVGRERWEAAHTRERQDLDFIESLTCMQHMGMGVCCERVCRRSWQQLQHTIAALFCDRCEVSVSMR